MWMTELARLANFDGRHSCLFVLTGADSSNGSRIPDYRDEEGRWKRPQPMTLQVFLAEAVVASLPSWPMVSWKARAPQAEVEHGAAHGALAMTTPGDASMVRLEEVEAVMKGKGARAIR